MDRLLITLFWRTCTPEKNLSYKVFRKPTKGLSACMMNWWWKGNNFPHGDKCYNHKSVRNPGKLLILSEKGFSAVSHSTLNKKGRKIIWSFLWHFSSECVNNFFAHRRQFCALWFYERNISQHTLPKFPRFVVLGILISF